MVKNALKTGLFISLLLSVSFFQAKAEVTGDKSSVRYTLVHSDQQGMTLAVEFPAPELLKASISADYFVLSMGGCYPSTEVGKPNVPVWNRMIELPVGASWSIQVTDVVNQLVDIPEKFRAKELAPVQPPVSKSGNKESRIFKDNQVYQGSSWFGYDLARIENDGIMRDARIARMSLSPVEYHPQLKQLRYIKSATITITFHGGVQDPVSWKAAYASPVMQSSTLTLNGSAFAPPPPVNQNAIAYFIVSDSMFQTALQPFIQWKRKKGFEVTEIYKGSPGVGTTATSIRNYLLGLWNSATPADPAPTYLLIVGDVQQIPAFTGTTGSHSTDLYYAEYTSDIFPELQYGRFSATTVAQLQPQIDKTLMVEQYLMVDPGYLQNGLLVAGNDATYASVWANGQMNYAQAEYVKPANGMVPFTFLYPSSSGQLNQIIQQFNEGVSLVNYSAHGSTSGWVDPAFTSTTVNSLTNTGRYPTVISNACVTNTFSVSQCFGESLLRAPNKGAVGHIGASANTTWDEDYYFSVGLCPINMNPAYSQTGLGFYDKLFHTHGEGFSDWAVTQGGIIQAGNLAVTQSGSSVNYYWEIYHLMGDPSLMPYLGIPGTLSPGFASTLPTGLAQVTVQTAPYHYVALTQNGTLYGAGTTNANGLINLMIQPITQAGSALLVITGQNSVPFIDTIHFITPTGPYVLADSVAFNDQAGNGNMVVEAGELIKVDLRLRNFTTFNSGALTLQFQCNDPYINIISGTLNTSGISGMNFQFNAAAFNFLIPAFVPDQHQVSGLIVISNGTSSWTSPFSFIINSPEIEILDIRISDLAGNSNGKVEPGEAFEFTALMRNTGHSALSGLAVNFEQNSNLVQLNTLSVSIPQFVAGQSYEVTFGAVALNYPIPVGSVIKVSVKSSKNGYADSLTQYKMLSMLKEDFETGGFTAYPWILTGTQPWFTTADAPYEGLTCARSGATSDLSSSTMQVEIPVISNDSILFAYKVSSEEDYDYLKFRIDNVDIDKWSGLQTTWNLVKFPVDSGLRTFSWSYEKDSYYLEGQDCAWIDYIVFPPTSLYAAVETPEVPAWSVSLFPNPASDILNVMINTQEEASGNVSLFTGEGSLLQMHPFSRNQKEISLHLSSLPSGIYLLVITSQNQVQTRKIIKY